LILLASSPRCSGGAGLFFTLQYFEAGIAAGRAGKYAGVGTMLKLPKNASPRS
jgi:hypothetical protein